MLFCPTEYKQLLKEEGNQKEVSGSSAVNVGVCRRDEGKKTKRNNKKVEDPNPYPEDKKEENSSAYGNVNHGKVTQVFRGRFNRRTGDPTVATNQQILQHKSHSKSPPPPLPMGPPSINRIHRVNNNQLHNQQQPNTTSTSQLTRRLENVRRPDDFSSASKESSLQIQPKSTSESVSSSVGSDVWRLRSMGFHRPPDCGFHAQSAFAVYDEKSNDPMQRAGLRLLSAAVIPIQCMVRKHLALREALTRMWAIVIIQACFVVAQLNRERAASIKIQALYWAGVVRDQVLLEQCCAIEIQRHVRGLLATLEVYENYKITLLQRAIRW